MGPKEVGGSPLNSHDLSDVWRMLVGRVGGDGSCCVGCEGGEGVSRSEGRGVRRIGGDGSCCVGCAGGGSGR